MTEVVFVGVPQVVVKAAIGDLSQWRVVGERMLERSKALCPVGKQQDAADMKNYGKEHGGTHLRDTMEVRYEFGLDPRIMVGSTLTRGDGNVSALGLIEMGTEAHEILPVNAQALRFTAGGTVVFAARVQHPGTKQNPFIERAMRQVILEAVVI